ncbi:MAG: hypothetical protein AAGI17_05615 [Planctomycetota bacterium]
MTDTPSAQPETVAGGFASAEDIERAARASAAADKKNKTLFEKMEAGVSKLSTRNNFWHRVCSLIWLPYAFRSGIQMRRIDGQTFSATLPFRRFNKNWYNAMAGAALLGNSEIAGGMYVFGFAGGDYTVVCKHLEYRFLRPCFGPAEYRIKPQEPIEDLIATGEEFNIKIDMDIVQTLPQVIGSAVEKKAKKRRRQQRKKEAQGDARLARLERLKKREKRVGRATATFHVTPKAHHKAKAQRHKEAAKTSDAGDAAS